MTALRKGMPNGMTRVIGVDLFDHEDYLVKDCKTREEAFKIADDHNRSRSGSMDDVYYVYDDAGVYLRGEEAVYGHTGRLGVSP